MTIAERRACEAYNRENPWRPMCEAKPDGTVCELLFSDLVGSFEADPFRYFLDHDGCWYWIDPPERVQHRRRLTVAGIRPDQAGTPILPQTPSHSKN